MSENKRNPILGMFSTDSGKELKQEDSAGERSLKKSSTEDMFVSAEGSEEGQLKDKPAEELVAASKKRAGELTAEERLLRVLEGNGEFVKKSVLSKFKSFFAGGFFEKIAERFRGFTKRPLRECFDLATVNKMLAISAGTVFAIAVVNPFVFKPSLEQVYSKVAKIDVSYSNGNAETVDTHVDEYLDAIGKRSLFHINATEDPKKSAPSVAADDANKILDALQLVGIAWGTYPEAMIRDKDSGRTHFLKEGQQLRGVKVKTILKDRVMLEYGGNSRELM